MPNHREIYQKHADQYELLISREDYQHNILKKINEIRPLVGLNVVELGAGTGRLTCLLAPLVKSILAFDLEQHMLDLAIAKLRQSGLQNWRVKVADHLHLPDVDQPADLVISGWSICYLVENAWESDLGKVLSAIKRILRPDGTTIILETLGTGYRTPHPPDKLVPYYDFLKEQGFQSSWFRTDYQFHSSLEAGSLVRFFFGDELANAIEENQVILPECTGIWWR